MTTPAEDLLQLSRKLGDPAADLVILGEGNTSADLGDGSFLVKASGCQLGNVQPENFVRLDGHAVRSLISNPTLDDHDIPALQGRLRAASAAENPAMPSIEAMLHALALELPGIDFVGHTHPVAMNVLLCSDRAEELVAGPLFPDQVVVCGLNNVLVPYADPGLPLARAVQTGLRDHLQAHGVPPKVIYLGNHGMVALGGSAREVLQITEMAVKAARVLHGVLTVGNSRRLSVEQAARLNSRPDEQYRRAVLAGANGTGGEGTGGNGQPTPRQPEHTS